MATLIQGTTLEKINVEHATNDPLISIITSTYNAGKYLAITANSIRAQSYSNLQWIIADGGSIDNTLSIIKENEDIINYWFSEPDNGIYNAWNKACKHITGQWVIFIGAGDEFAASDILKKMAGYLVNAYPKYDIVYGQLELVTEKNRICIDIFDRPWKSIKNHWEFYHPQTPIHPEIFHHSSIFNSEFPFDESLSIAGDCKLILQNILFKDPLYVSLKVTKMMIGGVSANPKNLTLMRRESLKLVNDLGLKPPLNHKLLEDFKYIIKIVIFNLVPNKFQPNILDMIRTLRKKNKKWTIS